MLAIGNCGFTGHGEVMEALIRKFWSTALVGTAKSQPHSQVMLNFSNYLLAVVG